MVVIKLSIRLRSSMEYSLYVVLCNKTLKKSMFFNNKIVEIKIELSLKFDEKYDILEVCDGSRWVTGVPLSLQN